MKKFTLEICANSVESSIMAQQGGAHRVELCDNINAGGTTPSHGAIQLARKKLFIDLNIIIRPRGGDFLYSEDEFVIMCNDIQIAKKLGVNGVVFGILMNDRSVDTERTKYLVKLAKPMSVTFHRAFDVCNDPFKALGDIIDCGCDRLLTSGQENKASDGASLIKDLIEKANERIIIMPGSGIDERNIADIYKKTGAKEFYASLRLPVKSTMDFKKEEVSIGGITGMSEFERMITSSERVKRIIEIINRF